jgi:lipopolysaccharide/colanic/teichoic acid biosynthesis glycosyltransferase
VKRAFDLVVAVVLVVLTSPVWLVTAIVVKLTTSGPVFHRATRVGKDGRPFTLLKFRTMYVDAPGLAITSADDPRITAAGRILRQLKIDELPQFVNVLRGDMTLVGPRPEDPRYVERYTPEQRRVLSVRPGITSPASVAYRNEEHLIEAKGGDAEQVYINEVLPAKLALDLDYIDRRSFWRDMRVLVLTVGGVLRTPRASRAP